MLSISAGRKGALLVNEDKKAFDAVYKEAEAYRHGLLSAATLVIPDGAIGRPITEGAMKEVIDALANLHGLLPEDINMDMQAPEGKQEGTIALTDAIDEDGIILKAAKLCKDNGVLPYYIILILAHLLADKDESPIDASIFREYADFYGLKNAITKFCGLKLEPELRQMIADQYCKIARGQIDEAEKITLMKRAYTGGFNSEKIYRGCGQCTLLTMFELFGRKNKALFQSASGLSGGMGLSGDGACGGYSGGILYMGSIIGRRLDCLEDGDVPNKQMSFRMAQLLRDRFIDTYGSVICADIHRGIFGKEFCLRTAAVRDEFEAAGAHTTKCTGVIGMVCTWLAEIIVDCGYSEKVDEA